MVSGSGPTVFGLFDDADGGRTRGRRSGARRAIRRRAARRSGAPTPPRRRSRREAVWLAGAVALALFLVVRRRDLGRGFLALGALAAAGAGLVGFGVDRAARTSRS